MPCVRAAARKSSEVASAMASAAADFQSLVLFEGVVAGREEKSVSGVVIVCATPLDVVVIGLASEVEVCRQVFVRCTRGSKLEGDAEGGA